MADKFKMKLVRLDANAKLVRYSIPDCNFGFLDT